MLWCAKRPHFCYTVSKRRLIQKTNIMKKTNKKTPFDKAQGKNVQEMNIFKVRHSLSHLLATAVLEQYPKTKLGIGPVIENGFYYDIDTDSRGHNSSRRTKFSTGHGADKRGKIINEDLPTLEKKMRELIREKLDFKKEAVTYAQAKKLFAGQPYKLELVEELKKSKQPITIYTTGKKVSGQRGSASSPRNSARFVDLCAGPHIKNTSEINPDAFKLTRVAGAYWRGDEKNKMLTRVYGVAFATKQELDAYLKNQEEAEKRDHRKLGKELDLFVFADIVGKGLPLLTPKGTVIRKVLERFVLEEETKRGYQHVVTPPLAKVDLYKKSGHYPYYKETMYPIMKVDDEELILRPMTCPHHFTLYNSRPHSYKELPLRYAEISPQFRYEKSGELSGLTRVRMFCLADAHIMCAKDQVKQEIKNVLDLIDYANEKFGLKKGVNYRYRLSLGDRKNTKKYYKDDTAWAHAEGVLRSVLKENKLPFFEAQDEAAFYGPKIDIQMKKINGQEETAFTIQYDFVMPKRFALSYTDANGKEKEPVVIHRSSIGAFERIMAFLIEHYAGAFPVWLAPVQAAVLPVSDKHEAYAQKVVDELRAQEIRVELSGQNETLGKRIREAEMQKNPYILVVGDKEIDSKTVNVRTRGQKETETISVEAFVDEVKKQK